MVTMRLKVRALAGIAALVVVLAVFSVVTFQGGLSSSVVETRRENVPMRQAIDNHPLQPPDLKRPEIPPLDPKLEALQNSWAEIKGHLPLMRKDLDASNYTSGSEGGSRETDGKLLQRLLSDDVFRKEQNVATFLHIAHVLEEHRNKELGIAQPQPQNQDVPSRLSEEQPQEAEKPKPKGPRLDVQISDQIVNELNAVVDKMAVLHRVKSRRTGTTLDLYTDEAESELANWQLFHKRINQFGLYADDDPLVDKILDDLTHLPLVDMYQKSGGTQIKLVYYLSNEGRAMFKPMRFPREQETLPDHFYFTDYERHTAEIAAFHLDRVLGFHRVPPAAGRLVNVTHDVKRMADKKLLKTVFVSPAGNVCFHGQCDYYCDTSHAVCGHPEMMEGSMCAFLPSSNYVDRKTWRHPWRRSYHKREKADWETDMHYCRAVRTRPPYNSGRRLLDLMDMAVFDFIQGNLDRHHYETLRPFGNFTFPLHLDNGRGFGKAKQDYIDVLAPIYHCCLMRYSTLQRLMSFHLEEKLSDRMRRSLSADSLTGEAPILTEMMLDALDRRVRIILKTVHKCIQENGGRPHKVVVDDGF